jgi:signal transduction histidine kinase
MTDVMLTSEGDQEQVSLRKSLTTELDEVQAAYSEAVITIEGDVPAVDVLADEMLGSVFRNLLTNAIQHNDKPVPELTVRVQDRTDTVRVRVADNGPGVPDAQKEAIFGKGEKGLNSEGTGIGLHLVQTLVESYNGNVWVTDNDPEGAVFVVELPKDA